MTISTTLLFSRAVSLMSDRQSELAAMQEKVATGKQIVRPSDGADTAVNIARLKNTIAQFDGYKASLQSTGDRLQVEEAYLQGATDVLSSVRQLAIQGANGTLGPIDRRALAMEVDELTSEMINIANGTDANGNFLFGGSRNRVAPFQVDETGVARYTGDIYQSQIDFTSQRRSGIGRTGLDVFQPVLTGEFTEPKNEIFRVEFGGALEVGDQYTVTVDGHEFSHTVQVGDSRSDVIDGLVTDINAARDSGVIPFVEAADSGTGQLMIEGLAGSKHHIMLSTTNTSESLKTGAVTPINPDTVLDDSDLEFESRSLNFASVDFTAFDAVVSLQLGTTALTTTGTSFADLQALVNDLKAHADYASADFELSVDQTGDRLLIDWKDAKAVPATTKATFTGGGAAEPDLIDVTDNQLTVLNEGLNLEYGMKLEAPFEKGDRVSLQFEGVSFEYVVTGLEDGAVSPASTVSMTGVRAAVIQAINSDPLMSPKLTASQYTATSAFIRLEPTNLNNPGEILTELVDRGDINNQSLRLFQEQVPSPSVPEKVEFFAVLKTLSDALKADDQAGVQATIDQLTQMIDSTSLSLADIGSEMKTIDDEISINEDLKLQIQAALTGEEDLDYATAITKLQAKMLSLEAAQSSFAKISQLSLFDYLR